VTLGAAHLSRSFEARLAVDDVSFQVAPGETYGLLGPNGAGKTTTIRLVCGLLSADGGKITVGGMPISTTSTRRFGVFSRALAAPIRPRDLVLGEALCDLTLALGQALLIVGVGALLFGVSWGNPLAATALIGMWALVGTGAGMVSGTLFRTPEQATAIGPAVGIAFGMLGGCMWPLEIVPRSVALVGHATPQAWAVDAWVTPLSRGGGLADIAGYLAILAGYAVVLFAFASRRLQRSLVTS